jgi:hypothetical protein
MSGGRDLLGQPAAEPRKRGRPKGSGNKRAKDLKGYVEARFGGSAAQQMAAACMVTPAEVRKAGSVLKARIAKADELRQAIGCTLKEAFEILSRELAALAPYTDQRQPLAVEAVGDAFRPAVIVVEKTGVLPVIEGEVSRPKSHDDPQGLEFAEVSPLPPSHGE